MSADGQYRGHPSTRDVIEMEREPRVYNDISLMMSKIPRNVYIHSPAIYNKTLSKKENGAKMWYDQRGDSWDFPIASVIHIRPLYPTLYVSVYIGSRILSEEASIIVIESRSLREIDVISPIFIESVFLSPINFQCDWGNNIYTITLHPQWFSLQVGYPQHLVSLRSHQKKTKERGKMDSLGLYIYIFPIWAVCCAYSRYRLPG